MYLKNITLVHLPGYFDDVPTGINTWEILKKTAFGSPFSVIIATLQILSGLRNNASAKGFATHYDYQT